MEDEAMMEEGGEVMEEDKTADLTYQISGPFSFRFNYPSDWRILEEDVIDHPIDPNRSVLFLGLIGPVLEMTLQANNPGSGGYTIVDPTPFQVTTKYSVPRASIGRPRKPSEVPTCEFIPYTFMGALAITSMPPLSANLGLTL